MNRKSLGISAVFVAASCLASAAFGIITTGAKGARQIELSETVPVKILADYRDRGLSGVLYLGTYSKIDDAAALNFCNEMMGGDLQKAAAPGLCSCCIKPIERDGQKSVLFGRNMDLPNSFSPGYVFRVAEEGKYRSINIGYVNFSIETFDQIAETSAMAKQMYDVVPYMTTDAMNERGLILEVNMRYSCSALDCSGTRPGAPVRICSMNLLRYLCDRCATIDDALKLVDTLDVYTAGSPVMTWHASIAMTDASGRYGVLEFAKNKAIWHENQPGQTNFWLDRDAYETSEYECGLGRWDVLMSKYDSIQTLDDMAAAMKLVWYGQLYGVEAKEMTFDPLTENIEIDARSIVDLMKELSQKYDFQLDAERLAAAEKIADDQKASGEKWTTKFVLESENSPKVLEFNDFIAHAMCVMPSEAKKESGLDEFSAISYVLDSAEMVYHVRFFEQDEVFDFGLEDAAAAENANAAATDASAENVEPAALAPTASSAYGICPRTSRRALLRDRPRLIRRVLRPRRF